VAIHKVTVTRALFDAQNVLRNVTTEEETLVYQDPNDMVHWIAVKIFGREPRDTFKLWEPFHSAQEADGVLAELRNDPDPVIRAKADALAMQRQNKEW
jgi:hypothetical protein